MRGSVTTTTKPKGTLYISSLILEVTERCNLSCDHCLRGCARNMDMTQKIVDKVLSQVEELGTICFTGGEPTLNLPIIEYVFDQIRERGIPTGSFWLATNGVEKSLELATLLLKNADLFYDLECCGVAISVDEFHKTKTRKNPLRHLSFYDKSKEHRSRTPMTIIDTGNAAENGIGNSRRSPSTELFMEDDQIETVYVRANGDVLADCDVSYDFMDEHAICKVEELTGYVQGLRVNPEKKQ